MFKVLCYKKGAPFIPDQTVMNREYLVYQRTLLVMEKAKDYGCNEARIDILFEENGDEENHQVTHRLYNCSQEFSADFHKLFFDKKLT